MGDAKYVLHESMKRRWAFEVLFDKERNHNQFRFKIRGSQSKNIQGT